MGYAESNGKKIIVACHDDLDGFGALYYLDKFLGVGPIHNRLHDNIACIRLSHPSTERQLKNILDYAYGGHELLVIDYLLHPDRVEAFDQLELFEMITQADHHPRSYKNFIAAGKIFSPRVNEILYRKDLCGTQLALEIVRERTGTDVQVSDLSFWISVLDLAKKGFPWYDELSCIMGQRCQTKGRSTKDILESLAEMDRLASPESEEELKEIIKEASQQKWKYKIRADEALRSPPHYIWFDGCDGIESGWVPALIDFDIENPEGGRFYADLGISRSRIARKKIAEKKAENEKARLSGKKPFPKNGLPPKIAPFFFFCCANTDEETGDCILKVSVRSDDAPDTDAAKIAEHCGNRCVKYVGSRGIEVVEANKGGGRPTAGAWPIMVEAKLQNGETKEERIAEAIKEAWRRFYILCTVYTEEEIKKYPYGPPSFPNHRRVSYAKPGGPPHQKMFLQWRKEQCAVRRAPCPSVGRRPQVGVPSPP
ncbi:MAG: hypothetical protein P4M13_03715 [Alphaproteobacteria bacterium]|nr:hypothetical protein [Alphaproteobacteria bacterium]